MANVERKSQRTVTCGPFRLARPQKSGVLAMAAAAALISWFAITNHDPARVVSRVAPASAELSAPATTSPPASGEQGTPVAIAPVALRALVASGRVRPVR